VLARVVLPVLDRLLKAPVEAVVAPIAVELIPLAVVLKLDEVTVNALTPVLIDEAARPFRANEPLVLVRLTAPVVTLRPLDAVSSWLTVRLPPLVVVTPALPRVIALAVVVPIDSVPAVIVSTAGVRTEVPAYRLLQALLELPRSRVLLVPAIRDWLIEVAVRLDREVLAKAAVVATPPSIRHRLLAAS
jgi:hypothetical protein